MIPSLNMQSPMAESLDVIISVGFVRGIIMKEQTSRRRDWNAISELDSVKVVISAMVPSIGYQAEGFLSSEPLESPKQVGDVMKYNAVFPLKAKNSKGVPTRITLPGLMRLDKSEIGHGQYKRQTIELLITLVFGNEAITLGRATLLVTGEELKTKQTDLPIDTSKNTVIKLQKKSTFPMKRTGSLQSNKQGDIAPTSFKYDRRRRKYQIENDAVLRAYLKCIPSDPYGQNNYKYQGALNSTHNMNNQYQVTPVPKNELGIPKVIIPKVAGDLSMGGSVYSNMGGYPPNMGGSAVVPSHINEYRESSINRIPQSRGRSQSNTRPGYPGSVQGHGSIYSASNGRVPPPGHSISRQRSYSAPRQSLQLPHHGSGPDYSFSGSGAQGRHSSRGSRGHRQYGSSFDASYGTSVKKGPISQKGRHYGETRQIRSPSPQMYRQY
jgi:hypothetical protein